MEKQVIIEEDDFEQSVYNTKEWNESVKITRYEHNIADKKYVINYKTI